MKKYFLILSVFYSECISGQATSPNLCTAISVSNTYYNLAPNDTMTVYVTLSTTLGGYDIQLKQITGGSVYTPAITYVGSGKYKCIVTNNGTIFGPFCGDPWSVNTDYNFKVLIKHNGYDAQPVVQNKTSPTFHVDQKCTTTSITEFSPIIKEQKSIYYNSFGQQVIPTTGFYIQQTGTKTKKIFIVN